MIVIVCMCEEVFVDVWEDVCAWVCDCIQTNVRIYKFIGRTLGKCVYK